MAAISLRRKAPINPIKRIALSRNNCNSGTSSLSIHSRISSMSSRRTGVLPCWKVPFKRLIPRKACFTIGAIQGLSL